MPGTPWGPYQNSLLSGAFGTMQRAASERLGTAEVWSRVRQAVGSWEWQTSGRGGTPSTSELEAAGQRILSEQGVGIQEMNAYRGIAGEWRGAHEQLQQLGPQAQIMPSAIWTPPWAETTGRGVPAQYRARVQWLITPEVGEPFERWSTYALPSPLTSTADVVSQAEAASAKEPDSPPGSRGAAREVLDLQVEQI